MSIPTPSLINEVDMELMLLVIRGYTSSYSLWNYTQESKTEYIKPVAYKNVNQRFLRLARLRYLEETPIGGDNPHRRIDYKLTMQGLEQLIPYILNHLNVIEELVQYMDEFELDKKGFGDILMRKATSTNEVVKRYFELTGLQQVTKTALSELGVEKSEIKTSPIPIDFTDYLVQVSTFRPPKLEQILSKSDSKMSYHKQLYNIITSVIQEHNSSNMFSESRKVYRYLTDTDNDLTKLLLLPYFEEKTLSNLGTFDPYGDPIQINFIKFIFNCCYDTIKICGWLSQPCYFDNDKNKPFPSLPPDEIIQEYMLYLEKRPLKDEETVLHRIEEYEKRLRKTAKSYGIEIENKEKRLRNRLLDSYEDFFEEMDLTFNDENNPRIDEWINEEIKLRAKDEEWMGAPEPLDEINDNIFYNLKYKLEINLKMLILSIISQLGEEFTYWSDTQDENDKRHEIMKYKDISPMIFFTDQKFIKVVKGVLNNFNIGIRQLAFFNLPETKKEIDKTRILDIDTVKHTKHIKRPDGSERTEIHIWHPIKESNSKETAIQRKK